MNNKKIFVTAVLVALINVFAHSQITSATYTADSLQKIAIQTENNRQDSLFKTMMRDSLGLSSTIISQISSAKQNFISQSKQIISNNTMTSDQKGDALQNLLIQTDTTIKTLMGNAVYQKYGQVMARRRQESF